MKLNNRFLFGILSILLAAIIAFVALPTISRQTNGKTEIVRVTQPVLKGAAITDKDVEIVEVGNSIPSGKVAISLTVKTLASGLSDKLQPDDIIRIYHFLDTAKDIPELQFVKVLSVTDSKGYNVDNTKELSEEEEKQQSATITVLASPEQAKIITGLENDGMAHVALISRGNEALAEELLAEQDQLLTELYYPELLEPELSTQEGPASEQGLESEESTIDEEEVSANE